MWHCSWNFTLPLISLTWQIEEMLFFRSFHASKDKNEHTNSSSRAHLKTSYADL